MNIEIKRGTLVVGLVE